MKPIWKSKTFWANLLSAILAGIEAVGLADVIPAEHQTAFIAGMACINIALRMITDKPVRLK